MSSCILNSLLAKMKFVEVLFKKISIMSSGKSSFQKLKLDIMHITEQILENKGEIITLTLEAVDSIWNLETYFCFPKFVDVKHFPDLI